MLPPGESTCPLSSQHLPHSGPHSPCPSFLLDNKTCSYTSAQKPSLVPLYGQHHYELLSMAPEVSHCLTSTCLTYLLSRSPPRNQLAAVPKFTPKPQICSTCKIYPPKGNRESWMWMGCNVPNWMGCNVPIFSAYEPIIQCNWGSLYNGSCLLCSNDFEF